MKPDVVYLVGGMEIAGRIDLKYSIRSVERFLPGSRVWIVGDLPDWHTGENHIYYPDSTHVPYINTFIKLREACRTREVSDDFIYFDDDMILLRPYQPVTYTNGMIKKKAKSFRNGHDHWSRALIETAKLTPGGKNYCTHTPLPVNKTKFLTITDRIDELRTVGVVQRQIYGHFAQPTPTAEAKDVKLLKSTPKQLRLAITTKHMISLGESMPRHEMGQILNEIFPEKSHYEK